MPGQRARSCNFVQFCQWRAMPELPEVETVCRALAPFVTDQTFAAARVHWARTVEPHDPAGFVATIPGKRVLSVSRRAKLIVFELSDDLVLTTHLRMTGNLRFIGVDSEPEIAPQQHLRLEFDFESGDALHFYDARKFGRVRLYSSAEWAGYQSDRKSTRLNSSHVKISYAVFCL